MFHGYDRTVSWDGFLVYAGLGILDDAVPNVEGPGRDSTNSTFFSLSLPTRLGIFDSANSKERNLSRQVLITVKIQTGS